MTWVLHVVNCLVYSILFVCEFICMDFIFLFITKKIKIGKVDFYNFLSENE